MACAGDTWLKCPLYSGLTPNALSRPKDGGLVAVLSVVLRSSVIFTDIIHVVTRNILFKKIYIFIFYFYIHLQ